MQTVESLVSFVRRSRKTRPSEPVERVPLPEEYRVDRQFMLLYTLFCLGSLSEREVGKIAEELHADAKANTVRSVAEVIHASGVLARFEEKQKRKILNDHVLANVGLRYTLSEMETTADMRVLWEPGMTLPGFVESAAGTGPARPLLLDLYSNELTFGANYVSGSMGVKVARSRDSEGRNDIFFPVGSRQIPRAFAFGFSPSEGKLYVAGKGVGGP